MDIWDKLIEEAKKQYAPEEISPFITAHHVACALEAEDGTIYGGFCIEGASGVIALCAERVAALNMYIQSGQKVVKRLTCYIDGVPDGVIENWMPCGACREFFMQLSDKNKDMEILVNYETRETVKLIDIFPAWWGLSRYNAIKDKLDKKALLSLINSLGLKKDEFYVVSSGALVLRDLLPSASDLDLAISPTGLNKLKAKFSVKPKPDNEDWFIVSDKIECVLKDMSSLPFQPELAENVPVQNIMEYYEYLLTSEREKDKARIPIVANYIQQIAKFHRVSFCDKYFDFAVELIFNEWGDGNVEHLKLKKERLKADTNTICYVLEIENTPVGTFLICTNDIKGYPEFNPNLACVCIDPKFRGKGYSTILMNKSNEVFKQHGIKKAYLKTTLTNFYEKFGWKFVKNIIVDGNNEKLYEQVF